MEKHRNPTRRIKRIIRDIKNLGPELQAFDLNGQRKSVNRDLIEMLAILDHLLYLVYWELHPQEAYIPYDQKQLPLPGFEGEEGSEHSSDLGAAPF